MNQTTAWVERLAGHIEQAGRLATGSAVLVGHVLGNVERMVDDVLRDSATLVDDGEALYRLAARHSGDVRRTVRAAPRFARTVSEVLRVVAAYRLHRKKALLLGPERTAESLERLHAESAERLYALCVEMRGGLLKLGQLASARLDLLPPAYVSSLSRLQDRVPPVAFEAIAARIEAELGAPPAERFTDFEEDPIAAASLSQVHAARLADGTEVVVKVLLPGIEEIVETDLAAFRVLAEVLRDVFPELDLVTIARELDRSLREELDFAREAEHAQGFVERLAGSPHVVVPRVYPEHSSGAVLTLGRLRGERLVEFLDGCGTRGDAGADDRDRLLERLVDSFCEQVLAHGAFQADPHPGNFLVLEGARVGLLDFGCVKHLSPETRRCFAAMAGAVIGGDRTVMAELFAEMGFRTRSGDTAPLEAFAEMFLDLFRTGLTVDLADVDPIAELEHAMALAKAHPLVEIPQDFVLLGRVFATLGGLVMHYRPRISLQDILLPHLITAGG